MLTFEEKLKIIEEFPELTRKDVSLNRVNFHYEDSIFEKKIVVYHLHPNGNGFVYAERIDFLNYPLDKKGMVNIRDFNEEDLREIIRLSIESLSPAEPEVWVNDENHTLTLVNEYDLWNVYSGDLLDGTFTTQASAINYLEEEGFRRK